MPICRICSNIVQKQLSASKSVASNVLLDSLLQSYGGKIHSQTRCKSYYRKETPNGLNQGDSQSVHSLGNKNDQKESRRNISTCSSVESKRKNNNNNPNVIKNYIHAYAIPKHVVKKKIVNNKKFKTFKANKSSRPSSASGKGLDIHVTVFKGNNINTKPNENYLEQNQEDGLLEAVLNLRSKKKVQHGPSTHHNSQQSTSINLTSASSKGNLVAKPGGPQTPAWNALFQATKIKGNDRYFENIQEDGVLATVLNLRDDAKQQLASKIKKSIPHTSAENPKDLLGDFYKDSLAKGNTQNLEEAQVNSSSMKSGNDKTINIDKDIHYYPRKSFWDSVFRGSAAKTSLETNEQHIEEEAQEDALLKTALNEQKTVKEITLKVEPSILSENPTTSNLATKDVNSSKSLDKIIQEAYDKAINRSLEKDQDDIVIEAPTNLAANSVENKEITANMSDNIIEESEDKEETELQQIPREKTLFDYVKRFDKGNDRPAPIIDTDRSLYAVSNKLANDKRQRNASRLKRDKQPGNSNTIGTVREMSAQVIHLQQTAGTIKSTVDGNNNLKVQHVQQMSQSAAKNENSWIDDLINFIYRKCEQNNYSEVQETQPEPLKGDRTTMKNLNTPVKVAVDPRRSFSTARNRNFINRTKMCSSQELIYKRNSNSNTLPNVYTTKNFFEELKNELYLLFKKYPDLLKSFSGHNKRKRVIIKPSSKVHRRGGLPVLVRGFLKNHNLLEDVRFVNNSDSPGVKLIRDFRTCGATKGFEDNKPSKKPKTNQEKFEKGLQNAKIIAKTLVDYSKKSYRKYRKVKEKVVEMNEWIKKVTAKPTKFNTTERLSVNKPIKLTKKAEVSLKDSPLSGHMVEYNTFDRQELLKILRELKQQRSKLDGNKKGDPDTMEFIMRFKGPIVDNRNLNQEKKEPNVIADFSKKPLGNLEKSPGLSTEVSSIKKQDDTLIPKHLQYNQKPPLVDNAKDKAAPKENLLNFKQQEKQSSETKKDTSDFIKELFQSKNVIDEKLNAKMNADTKNKEKEKNPSDGLGSYKKVIEEAQIKGHRPKTSQTMPKDSAVSEKKAENILESKQSQSKNNQVDQIAQFLREIQALGTKKEPKKLEKKAVSEPSDKDFRLLLSKRIIDDDDKNPAKKITKYMKNYLKYIIPPAKTEEKVVRDQKKPVASTKKVAKPQLKPNLDVFEPLNEQGHMKNYFMEVQEAFRLLLSKKIVDDESETSSTINTNTDIKEKTKNETNKLPDKYLDEQESLTSNITVQNVVDEINTTLEQNDNLKNEKEKIITLKLVDNERFKSKISDEKNEIKPKVEQSQTKEEVVKPFLNIRDDDNLAAAAKSKKFIQNDLRLLLSKKIIEDEPEDVLAEHEIKSNTFVIDDIIERSFLTPYADIEEATKSDVTYEHNNGSVKLIGAKEFDMVSLEMLTQSVRDTVDDLLKQNNAPQVTKPKDDGSKKGPKSGQKEDAPDTMLRSSVLHQLPQQSRIKEEDATTQKDTPSDKPNKTQFQKLEPSRHEGMVKYKNSKGFEFLKTNIIRFMIIKAIQDIVLIKSVKIMKSIPNNKNSAISVGYDRENGVALKNPGLTKDPVNIRMEFLNHFMFVRYLLKPKVSMGTKGRKGRISRNYSTNDSGDQCDSSDPKSKKSGELNLKISNDTKAKKEKYNDLHKYWMISFLNSRGLCDAEEKAEDKRNLADRKYKKEIESESSTSEETKNTLEVGNIKSENDDKKLLENEWVNRIACGMCSKIDNDNEDQERSSIVIKHNSNPVEANSELESEQTSKEFVVVDGNSVTQQKHKDINKNVILLESGKPVEGNCTLDLDLSNTSKDIEELTLQNENSNTKSFLTSQDHQKERVAKINELLDMLICKLDHQTNRDLQDQIARIKRYLQTFSPDRPNKVDCKNSKEESKMMTLKGNVKTEMNTAKREGRKGSGYPRSVIVHENKDVQLMVVPQDNGNKNNKQTISSNAPTNDLYKELVKGFIESEITESACKARTCLNQNDLDKGTKKLAVGKFPLKTGGSNNYYKKDENKLKLFLNKTANMGDTAESTKDMSKVLLNDEPDSGISSLQEHLRVPKIVKMDTNNSKCCSIDKKLNLHQEPVKESKIIRQHYIIQRSKSVHEYIRSAKNTAFNKVVELSDYFIIAKNKRKLKVNKPKEIPKPRPSDKSSVKTRRRAGRAVQRYFSIKFPKKNKNKDDTGPSLSNTTENKEGDPSLPLKTAEEQFSRTEAKLKDEKSNTSPGKDSKDKTKLLFENVKEAPVETGDDKQEKDVNKLVTKIEVRNIEKGDTSEVSTNRSERDVQINTTISQSGEGNAPNDKAKPIIEVKTSLRRDDGNILGSEVCVTASDKQVQSETKLLGNDKGKPQGLKIEPEKRTKTDESKLSHIEKVNPKVTKATIKSKSLFLNEFLRNDEKFDKKGQEQQQQQNKSKTDLDEIFASFLLKNDSSVSETDNNPDKTEEDPRKYEDDATLAEELSLVNDVSDTKSHQSIVETQEIVKSSSLEDTEPSKTKLSEQVSSSPEKPNLPMVIKPDNHTVDSANKKTYTKNILRFPGFCDIMRLQPSKIDDLPKLNLQKTIVNNEYNRLTNLASPAMYYSKDLYSNYLNSGLNFQEYLDKMHRSGLYQDFMDISTMAQLALYTHVKQGINDIYPTNSSLLYKSLQSIIFQNFLECIYKTNGMIKDGDNFYEHCFDTLKCLHNNYRGLWELAIIPRGILEHYTTSGSLHRMKPEEKVEENTFEDSRPHKESTPKVEPKSIAPTQKVKVIVPPQKFKQINMVDEEDDQTTTAYLDCLSKCSFETEGSDYCSLDETAIMPEFIILPPYKKTHDDLQKDQTKTDPKSSHIHIDVSKKAKATKHKPKEVKIEDDALNIEKEPSNDEIQEEITVPLEDFQVQMSLNIGSQIERKAIVRKALTAMTLKLTEIATSSGDDTQKELEYQRLLRDPQNEQFIDQISNISLMKTLDDREIKKTLEQKPLRVKQGLNLGTFVTSDGNIAYKLESCKPKDERENVYDVAALCVQEIERKERLLTLTSLRPSTLLCCGINPTSNNDTPTQ